VSTCAFEGTTMLVYRTLVSETDDSYAPLWLRGAVIATCLVGLYAKEEIFSLIQLGRSVA
jgi:hypothetical protein